MKNRKYRWILPVILIVLAVVAYFAKDRFATESVVYSESVMTVPVFTGDPFVAINDNQPEFTEEDYTTDSYEYYGDLDRLDRCTIAMACVGVDLMPNEERESISSVKPSGWIQAEYDIIDGKSLFNRCHLIGFQLTGENANERNLITGTRFMNVEGMLPFENMVADYVKETNNHVLYRVTPVYDGINLVARGVQMEALSMEDSGEGVCFNVYVYNNQPGIVIDYTTGESHLEKDVTPTTTAGVSDDNSYVLNTNSMKFHDDDCSQADSISQENRETYTGDRQTLIDQGYVPAGCCDP